jgi:hypothetical protein
MYVAITRVQPATQTTLLQETRLLAPSDPQITFKMTITGNHASLLISGFSVLIFSVLLAFYY